MLPATSRFGFPACFRFPARRAALVLLMALLVGTIALRSLARQTPQELARQGDRLWQEKSYVLALEAYQKALQADPKLPDQAEIRLRVAIALREARQWDAAIASFDIYVKQYRNSILEARAQTERARLYTVVEHQGYRVGSKTTRTHDVPPSDAAGHAPVAVNFFVADQRTVLTAMERGKAVFDALRNERVDANERARRTRDEIALDFDLSGWLNIQSAAIPTPDAARGIDWTLRPDQPYRADWPTAKKVMMLFTQIIALDAALPDSDHHNTVLATLGEAVYIVQLRQTGWYYPQYGGYPGARGRGGRFFRPRPVWVNIPYRKIDPIGLLEDVLRRYPQDREADRVAFLIALWTEQKGETFGAIARYDAFLRQYPQSRWASDARLHRDEILRPTLGLGIPALSRPGQRAVIGLSSRNVRTVQFTAYRVHLEDVFGRGQYVDGDSKRSAFPSFNDLVHHFDPKNGVANVRREKIAEWSVTTSDTGNHQPVSDTITTPLDTLGAYLIEARAGQNGEFRTLALAIVSDIAAVQRTDADSTLVYVADAETGKPIENAQILLWKRRNTGSTGT